MTIRFKPVETNNICELVLIFSWRNDSMIFKYFYSQNKIIDWTSHRIFWENIENRNDFLIIYDGRPIGHIAIKLVEEESHEVSILIGEKNLWGKGVATSVLEEFMKYCYKNNINRLIARISDFNQASVRLFQRQGFVKNNFSDLKKNWSYYVKIL